MSEPFDPEKLAGKLRNISPRILKMLADGLYAEELLMEADAKENCPVAPGGARAGELRASIKAQKPVMEDGDIVGRITCGDGLDYAIAVHEYPSEHSPESWLIADEDGNGVHFNVGGPKFLENAVLKRAKDLSQRVAARVDAKRAAQ